METRKAALANRPKIWQKDKVDSINIFATSRIGPHPGD
jgi:hypothetical protein